jgi:hypothetical protein
LFVKFDLITPKGGSLKRSLGMASPAFTIPIPINDNRDEAATQLPDDNLQIQA